MSRIANLLAVFVTMALVASSAIAQSASQPGRDQYSTDRNMAPGQPGMSSTSRAGVSEEPKAYFQAARESFNSKDYNASAAQLRLSADILRRDAATAKGMTAHNLRSAAGDLDKLADRVQRGEVRSVDDLNDRIGESYRALSNFHYQMARESYNRNRAAGVPAGRDVETGNYLNAAANDLESWAAFTGRTVESGTRTTISAVQDLAGHMISGTGWAAEKAGTAIDNLGTTIRNFGRRVTPGSEPQSTVPVAPQPAPGGAGR